MDRVFGRWLSSNGVAWVQTGGGIPWKLNLAYAPNRWIVYGKYEGSGFLTWAKQAPIMVESVERALGTGMLPCPGSLGQA